MNRTQVSVSAIVETDQIGEGSFIWYFAHVSKGVKIGKHCTIGEKSFIGEKVIIGNNVKIGNGTNIYAGAIIKDGVFIGNGVAFTNVRKPNALKPAEKFLDIIIDEGASIGANATVVGGVKIGKNAVIADGAVVIGNIADGVFAAGNPAKPIKKEHA